MENSEVVPQDIITNDVYPFFEYENASQTQRLLNFIIDNIIIRLTLSYATGYLVGKTLAAIAPEFTLNLVNDYGKAGVYGSVYIFLILNYLIYYTLSEKLFKGQTIGKLITGSRAVKQDGEELTIKDAFLRSACRLIPLEVFSGFGRPWHDTITHTMVIKTR